MSWGLTVIKPYFAQTEQLELQTFRTLQVDLSQITSAALFYTMRLVVLLHGSEAKSWYSNLSSYPVCLTLTTTNTD